MVVVGEKVWKNFTNAGIDLKQDRDENTSRLAYHEKMTEKKELSAALHISLY